MVPYGEGDCREEFHKSVFSLRLQKVFIKDLYKDSDVPMKFVDTAKQYVGGRNKDPR